MIVYSVFDVARTIMDEGLPEENRNLWWILLGINIIRIAVSVLGFAITSFVGFISVLVDSNEKRLVQTENGEDTQIPWISDRRWNLRVIWIIWVVTVGFNVINLYLTFASATIQSIIISLLVLVLAVGPCLACGFLDAFLLSRRRSLQKDMFRTGEEESSTFVSVPEPQEQELPAIKNDDASSSSSEEDVVIPGTTADIQIYNQPDLSTSALGTQAVLPDPADLDDDLDNGTFVL